MNKKKKGNYKLKTKYREAKLEKDEIKFPVKIIDPSEIIQYVRSLISEVVRPKKDQPEKKKQVHKLSKITKMSHGFRESPQKSFPR